MAAITRALVSVSEKRGVVEFARGLTDRGVAILSTGGTAEALRKAGIAVTDVAAYTASPEVMDGRVKTLHPRVHGGILMRDQDDDRRQLEQLGGLPIDLVVVNLYPFAQTVAKNAPHAEIVENIDIGGPSMIRSAAKNHARVTVAVDPDDYGRLLEAIDADAVTLGMREALARKAFAHTAAYDGAIARYFSDHVEASEAAGGLPAALTLTLDKAYDCRYGENPHQRGALYLDREGVLDGQAGLGSLARAESLDGGGKELSFNNLVDLDAALEAVREFQKPAAVVVKHTNPCGVATADDLEVAFRNARAADPLSAFGGIVALNRPVDRATAAAMAESFLECVVAPSFAAEALETLRAKKALRLIATGDLWPATQGGLTMKRIAGGFVVQDRDATAGDEVRRGQIVTRRSPSDDELSALDFAWRVCKHVKSNAIVLALGDRTVGVGAGQMSRVVSVELAAQKAGDLARGAVMASDAFFPFPDGIEAAGKVGVTAVAQPGGSKKDGDVIAAADALGLAMVMTGARHFRH